MNIITKSSKVANSDSKIGWGGFLPFWYIHIISYVEIQKTLKIQATPLGLPHRDVLPVSLLSRLCNLD